MAQELDPSVIIVIVSKSVESIAFNTNSVAIFSSIGGYQADSGKGDRLL